MKQGQTILMPLNLHTVRVDGYLWCSVQLPSTIGTGPKKQAADSEPIARPSEEGALPEVVAYIYRIQSELL